MKKFLFLSAGTTGLLLLTACGASNTAVEPSNDDQAAGIVEDGTDANVGADDTDSMVDDSNGDAMAPADDSEARVIDMTVTDFEFAPTTLALKKGEKVVIRLKGGQGRHSLGIPDLGINAAVDPGQTIDVEIPTDKTGTFSFRCMIPCGPGHRDMVGSIVVS